MRGFHPRRVTRRAVLGGLAALPSLTSRTLATSRVRTVQSDPGEVTALTLVRASELLHSRVISPMELTQACLNRIDNLNPRLNAFITVAAEQALVEARAMDAEQRRGIWRGPLHGIPIALKDNIDTASIRTTAASELFKDRIPSEDATVVRKLKSAGAIFLGKTNLHEFAAGGSSSVSYFGAVHNPWDPARIPGGSSGGSAAAVAAGLCFAALGTDTAGSLRIPASYCGIVGFKPTYGRVSNRGVIPLSWTLDHVGPLCRNVQDAAVVLQVIAGYDELDPASSERPVPDYNQAFGIDVSRLRLGIARTPFFDGLDPDVAEAVEAAVSVVSKMTLSTAESTLPSASLTLDEIFAKVRGVEAYTYHSRWLAESPEKYQAPTRQRITAPPNLSGLAQNSAEVRGSTYMEARRQLDLLRREIGKAFATVDLLILPTMPSLPVLVERGAEPSAVTIRNTSPFDILGIPAVSVPCGFTASGLPIGLQIVGAPFAESAVLALAHAYEQATEWHRRSPPA
jgi:aspartyl-tRNA(Asn)/glutamyl-tRNA(Gln) amidotransferase subunit A